MKKEAFSLEQEQQELVLARFKTLNPESKIVLGGEDEITVREIIKHIEEGDIFGKKIVQVQINMLKILSIGAE